ncbi:uncharacterized protein [Dermacentor andersoni]|uniref:uncharacterized protein n=1 Tax=Dermacentor andersoni TaxID=34620 RepID=UPI003B3A2AAC
MQNDLCNGASTWDVIMRHKDFMRLPPPNMSKPIKLEIIELQQKPGLVRRAVLALDVSYSMDDHMRLETMKDVVDDFLLGLLPDTVHLAIVSFSEKARVEHSMEPVNKRTLKGFRDCVKKMRTSSATCIGCALRKALELPTAAARVSEPEDRLSRIEETVNGHTSALEKLMTGGNMGDQLRRNHSPTQSFTGPKKMVEGGQEAAKAVKLSKWPGTHVQRCSRFDHD